MIIITLPWPLPAGREGWPEAGVGKLSISLFNLSCYCYSHCHCYFPPFPLSPYLPISLSPYLSISLSPYLSVLSNLPVIPKPNPVAEGPYFGKRGHQFIFQSFMFKPGTVFVYRPGVLQVIFPVEVFNPWFH